MNRDFAGYAFEYIGPIQAERDSSGTVREFMLQSRYRNNRALTLYAHGAGPFCQFTIAPGIHRPGVYVITLVSQPIYAGKCRDLVQRFGPQGYGAIQSKNCFVGGQSTNCKVNTSSCRTLAKGNRWSCGFTPSPSRLQSSATSS